MYQISNTNNKIKKKILPSGVKFSSGWSKLPLSKNTKYLVILVQCVIFNVLCMFVSYNQFFK
jgi:hypothetical protein